MERTETVDTALAALGVEDPSWLVNGGQKMVLKATLAGREVVVKIVPLPPGPGAPTALERARREVELLTSVDSSYVVKVLSDPVQIGERPEAVCWVEEYLDGQDLGALMAAKWTDEDVYRLLHDIGSGLRACHDLDVVHRDLSPGNVRRCSDGRFVLMDPGFARHLAKTALTGVFQPGTPGFLSPEHVPGGEPMPASDIFCLGILAFQARTGLAPVDPSGDEGEYEKRLSEDQVPKIQSLDASVSDRLAVVVDRCLLRQSARRYLDGSELLDALNWEEK